MQNEINEILNQLSVTDFINEILKIYQGIDLRTHGNSLVTNNHITIFPKYPELTISNLYDIVKIREDFTQLIHKEPEKPIIKILAAG